jgi:flagellar basal body-associated protein FliL
MGAPVLLLLIILLVLAGVGVGIFFIVKSSSKPKHPVYPPQQLQQQYPPQQGYPGQQQQYPPQGWGS